MLNCLQQRPSNRKLRLLAVACCRNSPEPAGKKDERYWQAGESMADGLNYDKRLHTWLIDPINDVLETLLDSHWVTEEHRIIQADLLRELVGNPFRPVEASHKPMCGVHGHDLECEDCGVKLYNRKVEDVCRFPPPKWLSSKIVSIAEDIYNDSDFDALPILADMLEESGCDNDNLLKHLHGYSLCTVCIGSGKVKTGFSNFTAQPNISTTAGYSVPVLDHCKHCNKTGRVPLPIPHARGCWALDNLLGKV